MKLQELHESKEVNLIGKTINGYPINKKNYFGDFNCTGLNLTSLKGCPPRINGCFECDSNQLTSLKYGPKQVKRYYSCNTNKLTSLEGAPEINNNFYCEFNELTNLKDIHKYIKEINGDFYANKNPITSHVLGLLKIKNLEYVELDNTKVQKILNKYLEQPFGNKRVIDCQSELLDAGYDDFAQL